MELILSRPGVVRSFTTEWTIKWVPAILSYSKHLKKKDIVDLLANHESAGVYYVNTVYIHHF